MDWNGNEVERIAAFQGASGDQLLNVSAAFSPDGTTFATALGNYGAAGDYTIVLWDLSPYVTPVVHIADFNLKAAIREALGKSGYGPLTRADMERLTTLDVRNREIRDLTGLESATQLTQLNLEGNPLNLLAANTHLPALEARGVEVLFSRMAEVLTKLSGDNQQAPSGTQVQDPFVVEVVDQNGMVLPGAVVAFSVTGGEGTLAVFTDTTDARGRAFTALTIGQGSGTITVEVRVNGLEPQIFTVTALAVTDFNGDGVTGLDDFFLFADAFGGSDPRFDLDGSGTVDFPDFFLFAENFGKTARAKLLAMASERIGLPEGPQLRQNAPNPFNSRTVISWFQLHPGEVRLEVFALTGQRVAVLHEGAKKIGLHRLTWDGRSDQGRPLAPEYTCTGW